MAFKIKIVGAQVKANYSLNFKAYFLSTGLKIAIVPAY